MYLATREKERLSRKLRNAMEEALSEVKDRTTEGALLHGALRTSLEIIERLEDRVDELEAQLGGGE